MTKIDRDATYVPAYGDRHEALKKAIRDLYGSQLATYHRLDRINVEGPDGLLASYHVGSIIDPKWETEG